MAAAAAAPCASTRATAPSSPRPRCPCRGCSRSSGRTALRVAVVVAIIVVTSVVALAQPFLVREVVDVALPAAGLAPAPARRRRDGRRGGRDPAARRRADLAVDAGRPAGDARAAHLGVRAPAAPVARLLHPHPRRRGAVAPHQRRQRHAGRRHLDRDLDRLEPHHRRRHRRRDGRAVVAAVAALAARHPAGPVADPQGRPAPPRGDRRRSSGTWPTSTTRSRRACRSAACGSPRRSAPRRAPPSGSATTSHELVDLELRSQLAGRWRMATMQIVFAVIPALVYLAAGLPGDRRAA